MGEFSPPGGALQRAPLIKRIGISAWVAMVAAIVLAGLNGANLLFTLYPEWKPDPRTRSNATVSSLALDQNVTQLQYFRRLGSTPEACGAKQLRRDGSVAYIQVDAAGFKDSSIGLKWFTYNAGNSRRVPGVRSNSQETKVFKPRAPINRQVAQVWVPSPLVHGEYLVRFELYSGNVLLAFADTQHFSVPDALPDQYKGPWCKPLAAGGKRGA